MYYPRLDTKDHTKLYRAFLALVESNGPDVFTVSHQAGHDGARYDVFSYRFANYAHFTSAPEAIWSRGIMFRIKDDVAELVALPMPKFFNYGENASTIGHVTEQNSIVATYEKLDGSLVSTYIDANGKLALKTKTSLHSGQAADATEWLDDHIEYKQFLYELTTDGLTVNMEWCSPANQIVIPYTESRLVLLNAVDLRTCRIYTPELFPGMVSPAVEAMEFKWEDYLAKYMPTFVDSSEIDAFVKQVSELKDSEGYVVKLANGQLMKMKAAEYLAAHRYFQSLTKFSQAVDITLKGIADDLRAMLKDNKYKLDLLDQAEKFVADRSAELNAKVNKFHAEHVDLNFKDYALKAQAEFKTERVLFSLAMSKKRNKEYGKLDKHILELAKNVKEYTYIPMWNKPERSKNVSVIDVDGTLSKMVNRGPFDYHLVGDDELYPDILKIVNALHDAGDDIVIVSGRDGVCIQHTFDWLNKHNVPFCALYQRNAKDNRKDTIVKTEIFQQCIMPKWNVTCVLDDRAQVVDALRGLGLRVLQVAPGDF